MNDISNVSDSVVEKIRKLLALGTSGNENESALALQKAKKLAAENEVDISLIEIFTKVKKNEPIVKNGGMALGNRKSITQRYVSWLLEKHFGVKVIYFGNRQRGMTMVLVGTKDKIAIAEYVQGFLNQEFMRLWRNYYTRTNCRLSERNSFLYGMYQGLCDKLEAEQTQVVTEKLSNQTEDTKNQFALMVVSEKERLNEALGQFFPSMRSAPRYHPKAYSSTVLSDGHATGQKITVRRSIANGCANSLIAA